ncbi:MAG: Flp pilus assembly complex ATPase component TadA, partial [Clostridiaceae bacterium]|nr:Flp pilus assembly complex ATPase component TadA [Clostridiaceae bacterium]
MGLLERLAIEKEDNINKGNNYVSASPKSDLREDPYKEIKRKIFERVVEEVKITNDNDEENSQILEDNIKQVVNSVFEQEAQYLTRNERNIIIRDIVNETIGFGPITPLLQDSDISEVMVNGVNMVYVERKGKIELTDVKFKDDSHVYHIIERIVSPLGRRIDESSPMVDARLP